MENIKSQFKKELPPFKGELQVIKIITGEVSTETKPLVCLIDFENASGDFNEYSPETGDFNNLASESGKRFLALVNH
jgi:hypothetical protein